jgi:renal tumor antigen
LRDRKKDLSMKKIKLLMYQLLKSIEYIHRKSIFHRDIKPENVLISGDIVKLADLGSCKGKYKSK